MNTIKTICSLACLIFIFNLRGQIFTIEEGDSLYLHESKSGQLELKDDLPKGEYWIIQQTECGPDTLKYAKFSERGIRHGTWINWESGVCSSTYVKGLWQFGEKYKFSETVYNNGEQIRTMMFSSTTYPVWIENTKRNILISRFVYIDKGYENEYFHSNGNLQAKGRTDESGAKTGKWIFRDESDQIVAEVSYRKGKPVKTKKFQDRKLPEWAYQ